MDISCWKSQQRNSWHICQHDFDHWVRKDCYVTVSLTNFFLENVIFHVNLLILERCSQGVTASHLINQVTDLALFLSRWHPMLSLLFTLFLPKNILQWFLLTAMESVKCFFSAGKRDCFLLIHQFWLCPQMLVCTICQFVSKIFSYENYYTNFFKSMNGMWSWKVFFKCSL